MAYYVRFYPLMTNKKSNKYWIIWYTIFTTQKQKNNKCSKRCEIMNKSYKCMVKRFKYIFMKNKYMNIKLQIIRRQLESLRLVLHFLLNFKKPTDKIVLSCSQQLDVVIVKYEKVRATLKKAA